MIKRIDTKRVIFESFCELCKRKNIEKITVDDIVENCGYKRGTFYYYYKDKEDMIMSVFSDVTWQVHESYYKQMGWSFVIRKNLEFCFENRNLMSILTRQNSRLVSELHKFMHEYVEEIIRRDVKHIHTEHFQGIVQFYCAGATAIYQNWIMDGYSKSIDEIVDLLEICMPEELAIYLNVKRERV